MTSIKAPRKLRLFLIAILCTVLWGSAIPSIKIGYDLFGIAPAATADKLVYAGIRFFGAGLITLLLYLIFSKKEPIPSKKELLKSSVILGMIQTAGQYFFMYIGLSYTTGVNASVFNTVGTLLYIVLAWIIFHDERLSGLKLFGCIIGFSGILLNSLATKEMGILPFRGDGFIILANVSVAIGFLYSKHSVKKTDPFLLTGIQMGIGGFTLLLIGLLLGGNLPTVSVRGVALLFYLMIVSSVAFSLWTLLLRDYPSALVGVFNFLTPVFGTVFSFLLSKGGLLDEESAFTTYTVLAIFCSAIGILLSSVGDASKQHRKERETAKAEKTE